MSESTARDPEGARPEARGDASHGARMVLVVALLAAGFALLPRAVQSCDGGATASGEAPAFTAPVVANGEPDQRQLSLAELRGRPVLLDFWATWCGPCQAEAPIVNGIAQRFRDKGLVVVGVNTSDERGLAEVWAKKKRLSFPIVYDEGNSIARSFRVENLPTLVVVSKEGKIVAVRHGITSDADLERLVRQVL